MQLPVLDFAVDSWLEILNSLKFWSVFFYRMMYMKDDIQEGS